MIYLSDSKLKEIVSKKIEMDEKLGEFAGGSRHSSDITYEINDIEKPIVIEEKNIKIIKKWRIIYRYTKYVTTEFTYYPDNPPYEYQLIGTLVVDEKGNIQDKCE